jgi:RNA polymerase sigma factor (sigma-70 family)
MLAEQSDIINKSISMIVRKLAAVFPNIAEQYQDEFYSSANLGVNRALSEYDSSRGKTLLGWLVFAGYHNSISNLFSKSSSHILPYAVKNGKRVKRRSIRTINETDLFKDKVYLTLDDFSLEKNRGLDRKACRRYIHSIIDEYLSALEKKIFIAFYINKKSYEQIAEEYGLKLKTVDNALIRAREKIKQDSHHLLRKNEIYIR